MKSIILDTNAILDLCYRNYPKHIFPTLWDQLEGCISSHMIVFHECASVGSECKDQIQRFQYDIDIYKQFIKALKVQKVSSESFAEQTMHIKRELLKYPATQKSSHVTRDNYADADIVALALSLKKQDCAVLSAEQINPNFSLNSRNSSIKVPNLCGVFDVTPYTWRELFEHLGVQI